MYIITKKFDESSCYVTVVRSKRSGNKVSQEFVAYLGKLDNSAIPYLKAAFLPKEKRPSLADLLKGEKET